MRYKKTIYIFLTAFILLNLGLIYGTNLNNQNTESFFRIHVVANSDSIDDQLLKYTVAKQVNKYINDITKDSSSKEESKVIVEKNIQNILNISNDIIKENNHDYTVKAYLGEIMYDEKQMDNIHMEPGIYDSLKIAIGNGNGQNWWSLIYPTSVSEIDNENIFSEDIEYKFGFIEIIKNMFI